VAREKCFGRYESSAMGKSVPVFAQSSRMGDFAGHHFTYAPCAVLSLPRTPCCSGAKIDRGEKPGVLQTRALIIGHAKPISDRWNLTARPLGGYGDMLLAPLTLGVRRLWFAAEGIRPGRHAIFSGDPPHAERPARPSRSVRADATPRFLGI